MKCTYGKLFLSICIAVFAQGSLFSLEFESIANTVAKGVKIADHVATGVDAAMGAASVGVSLWGSDADKARMAKGLGVTNMISSIARGNFADAEKYATVVRGKPETSGIYTPLTAEELASADIVAAP